MLSFGSYAVSDSGEFCWARLRFRCCVSWTSIQGIVGAGECVTPVSEGSVDRGVVLRSSCRVMKS